MTYNARYLGIHIAMSVSFSGAFLSHFLFDVTARYKGDAVSTKTTDLMLGEALEIDLLPGRFLVGAYGVSKAKRWYSTTIFRLAVLSRTHSDNRRGCLQSTAGNSRLARVCCHIT